MLSTPITLHYGITGSMQDHTNVNSANSYQSVAITKHLNHSIPLETTHNSMPRPYESAQTLIDRFHTLPIQFNSPFPVQVPTHLASFDTISESSSYCILPTAHIHAPADTPETSLSYNSIIRLCSLHRGSSVNHEDSISMDSIKEFSNSQPSYHRMLARRYLILTDTIT